MRITAVILRPDLTIRIRISISPAIQTIKIRISLSSFQQISSVQPVGSNRHYNRTTVKSLKMRRFFQTVQHQYIFRCRFSFKVSHGTNHIITDITVLPHKMSTYPMIQFPSQVFSIHRIIVQQHTVTIAVRLNGSPSAACCKTVFPRVGCQIDHRIFGSRHIVGPIHIIYIQRFFPRSNQSFIIKRSHLIYPAIRFIRLAASRIIMTAEYPLELSAHTVLCLFRQSDLGFHQPAHTFLAPYAVRIKSCRFRMQSDAAPCPIFTIQQLILL